MDLNATCFKFARSHNYHKAKHPLISLFAKQLVFLGPAISAKLISSTVATHRFNRYIHLKPTFIFLGGKPNLGKK